MPLHPLPLPPLRAYGSADPPNDMNQVVAALNSRFGNEFHINDYAADPTGAQLSDSAWQSCYADAVNAATSAGSATGGAVIMFGAGVYTFSPGIIHINDKRVGLVGEGKASTVLRTTGSNGILVWAGGGGEPGTPASAPVSGFTVYGWDAGTSATGIRFGDREYGTFTDIYANGWNNTGCTGFQIAGTSAAVAEGVDAWGLVAKNCNTGMSFDGTLGGTSADYSRWKLHAIDNNVALQFINGAHIAGGQFHLTGAAGSANWTAPTVFIGGNSGTDAWNLQNCFLVWGVEADSGSTTVTDMVLQGSAGSGIQNGSGKLMFLTATASFTAGSITTSRFSFNGSINGSPLLLGSTSLDAYRADLGLATGYLADAVQTPATSGTIKTATDGRYGVIPVNPSGAITGVILEKPAAINLPGPANGIGYQVTVINRSAFSITFAASGTSFVADGTSDVIAALKAATYTYDTGTSLWYRT